jgi:hypothetical protein
MHDDSIKVQLQLAETDFEVAYSNLGAGGFIDAPFHALKKIRTKPQAMVQEQNNRHDHDEDQRDHSTNCPQNDPLRGHVVLLQNA